MGFGEPCFLLWQALARWTNVSL